MSVLEMPTSFNQFPVFALVDTAEPGGAETLEVIHHDSLAYRLFEAERADVGHSTHPAGAGCVADGAGAAGSTVSMRIPVSGAQETISRLKVLCGASSQDLRTGPENPEVNQPSLPDGRMSTEIYERSATYRFSSGANDLEYGDCRDPKWEAVTGFACER